MTRFYGKKLTILSVVLFRHWVFLHVIDLPKRKNLSNLRKCIKGTVGKVIG